MQPCQLAKVIPHRISLPFVIYHSYFPSEYSLATCFGS